VKHGDVNASLPKRADPDKVTVEEAVQLLDERAAKARRRARQERGEEAGCEALQKARRSTAKKSTAKKTTAPAKKSS
jgi:DNA topoisomerase I